MNKKIDNNKKTKLCTILGTNQDILVGETFIDGQQKEVWCNSKIPITDRAMYFMNDPNKVVGPITKGVTCYRVSTSAAYSGLILMGDSCSLDELSTYYFYFFCE